MAKAQIIITSCSRRGLEVEQIKRFLSGNGYSLSSDEWRVDAEADLILISTCGFTQAAEDYGFATLRRVEANKKPGAQVIFGGCIPKINPERVQQTFDGPTFSPQSYGKLTEIIGAERPFEAFQRPNTFEPRRRPDSLAQDAQKVIDILTTFDGSLSGLEYISQQLGNGLRRRWIQARYANLNSQDTFYIQVQEGCSMRCSYCAIRMAIGPLRSRPLEAILSEFQAGLEQGYKHFQLAGDNAGSYGLDSGGNMGRLLERILEIDRDFVLDLTDINPVYLPLIYEPVQKLCQKRKISRFYAPIQSGSRRILKLMNRDCDMDEAREMLRGIRQTAGAKVKLGTSIVVGFPSETLTELDETITFCEDVGFDWVWCHSFSARPGTPAAVLPEQIAPEEILQRSRYVKRRLGSRALVTTADDTNGSKTCQG